MKTIAYLDCPSGISGDMCLGAILDAGVPLDYLKTQLDRLGLGDEFQLSAAPVVRQGLRALKAQVDLKPPPAQGADAHRPPQDHHHHSYSETHGPHGQTVSHSHSVSHSHVSHSHSVSHSHVSHSHSQAHGMAPSEAHASAHGPHHHGPHHHGPDPGTQTQSGDPAPHPAGTRHLPDIEALITQAGLPERVCHWSLAVFRQLAAAEAAVHGIAIDQVHFHEVGATDALVDIVGTCLGLDYLGIDTLFCSALPTGQGRVKAAHGWLPVPAPAVLKLMEMRQMPIYSSGVAAEQVTPTGAALVAALAQGFGAPPAMALQRVGLGAGQKDFPQANILRLWVGTVAPPTPSAPASPAPPQAVPRAVATTTPAAPENPDVTSPTPGTTETIAVLETQVDDMVPQAMGYLYDQLFAAGAVDVFTQPIAMKKSRTGLLITVLCPPEAEARCTEVLFAETPTLGIRHRHQSRTVLGRAFHRLDTPYGPVTLKLAYHPHTQAVLNVHPEYEDCVALARHHGVPWQVIYHTALGGWYQSAAGSPPPVEAQSDETLSGEAPSGEPQSDETPSNSTASSSA